MDLQSLLILHTLAQLPVLIQAFLIHPYYRKNHTARLARWMLAPLGIALWTWFTVEWRANPPKSGPASILVGLGVTINVLRSLVLARANEPYYRLPSKKRSESEASQVSDKTVSFVERLRHAILILMSPRGIGWSFGVPITDRGESNRKFLLDTLYRLFTDIIILLGSLIIIAKLYYSPSSQTFLSRHLLAFFSGTLAWTLLDCNGCFLRLAASALRLDPAEYPFFLESPIFSTSLAELWGRRWHSLLRHIFVELGSKPATSFVIQYYGSGALSRVAGILGAFLISGLMHEFGVWFSAFRDPYFRTTLFFFSQGVGVVMEATYSRLTNRRVSGLVGWIWMIVWTFGWGRPLIEAWIERDLLSRKLLRDVLDQYNRFI